METSCNKEYYLCLLVPGPCEPEDLIDGIIFAANYLGCTQVLSDKNPSKSVRMSQAHEAVSRIKVSGIQASTGFEMKAYVLFSSAGFNKGGSVLSIKLFIKRANSNPILSSVIL